MNYNNTDVIIARATPVGRSALAVVRLSGVNLKKIISIFFSQKKLKPNVMSRQTIKKLLNNKLMILLHINKDSLLNIIYYILVIQCVFKLEAIKNGFGGDD